MKHNPKVKATPADPHCGKPAWHGKFFSDGKWHTVHNSHGNPIIYESPEAACAAAWWEAPTEEE